ncbi:hypothetical protein [Sphingobium algorifonticola]|uniref:Uncharacterized protein n=1 Tax=Sphingobium algorifonticola TaxID=2008318 RepID=A0A437JAG2_9SPHN|nr:hypothetical protein [Sphingobium algorifonticola]RVT42282.1 hypothetical protein ENE74_08760 [Sphingobium algorifonticola]
MTQRYALGSTHNQPGKANAEAGVVLLDGPHGIAITMTPYAALETGKSLMEAAAIAQTQISEPPYDRA